ncbi:MAG TPA: DUF4295 domain-containing protein [Candidatus Coprenecus stercoripullorum]|nr:DUF4295 domain-containing protein [Candidatus Coprenecus stercoripullorum]
MAKKAVATFSGDKASKRTFVKCIRMDKSERSGAYIFKEELVPTDQTKSFFDKK